MDNNEIEIKKANGEQRQTMYNQEIVNSKKKSIIIIVIAIVIGLMSFTLLGNIFSEPEIYNKSME